MHGCPRSWAHPHTSSDPRDFWSRNELVVFVLAADRSQAACLVQVLLRSVAYGSCFSAELMQ